MPPKKVTMPTFSPSPLLRHPHTQTITSSILGKKRFSAAFSKLEKRSLAVKTQDYGVLQADVHKPNKAAMPTIFLLHGWEGSKDSGYILRAALFFAAQGYGLIRLNFRDHGDSHHLNNEPFNSARLLEVKQAITTLCQQEKIRDFHLLGFSLGGNFSIRLLAETDKTFCPLSAMSICAPIEPMKTSWDIENGWRVYHDYFVKKWHRSIKLKYRYYPELLRHMNDLYSDPYKQKKPSLNDMNEAFVPLHTDYDEVEHYFNSYRISPDLLAGIQTPCLILYAEDDPIIKAEHYEALQESGEKNPSVSIEAQRYGGHCGFIQNLKLDSFIEPRALAFFKAQEG